MDIQTYLWRLFPTMKVRRGDEIGVVTAKNVFSQRDANGLVLHTKPLHCQTVVLWPNGEFSLVDYLIESDLSEILSWELLTPQPALLPQ